VAGFDGQIYAHKRNYFSLLTGEQKDASLYRLFRSPYPDIANRLLPNGGLEND
jgi:hypothetical protein